MKVQEMNPVSEENQPKIAGTYDSVRVESPRRTIEDVKVKNLEKKEPWSWKNLSDRQKRTLKY